MSSDCQVFEFARVLIAAALAVAICGCGSPLETVRGTVQHEGSALTSGRIVFTPIGGGRTAFGEIQPDGSFQLTSERPNDGAAPGNYRIRVLQTEDSETGKTYTNHVAPDSRTLEVAAGKNNEFAIDIRAEDGWQTSQDK